MLKKKAQGMSMNIIVVAAIALVILVVLVVIFVGRSSKFVGGVEQCQGTCGPEASCNGDYQKIDYKGSCVAQGGEDTTDVCCISVLPTN